MNRGDQVKKVTCTPALFIAESKKYPMAIRHMKTHTKAAPNTPNIGLAKDEIIKWELMTETGK
jgi:hypothetical protein